MESLPLERIGLSNISNKPISLPLHLGMTEKSLFTEVIIFENCRIRSRTLIFHLGRGRMSALPLSYTASNYIVVRKNLLWKRFFSETRRELPFGFEPKTCWFVINCSIHLSYGSISRFLYFDSGWRVRKNIYLRTAKLRNSRCRSRTDYFKIMTLAWYFVPLICKRRMKDSNLQVVSDWLVSNQLQYHYGNTACDGAILRYSARKFNPAPAWRCGSE